MKLRKVILSVAIFGAGYASALLLSPQDLIGGVSRLAGGAEVGVEDRLVQTDFGSRCSTAQGVCGLPQPKPVGSVCHCGTTLGTTIR